METTPSKPSIAELAEVMRLPPDKATACDAIINPLIEMLRAGDEEGVKAKIMEISDSGMTSVFNVGLRAGERKISYMRVTGQVAALSLLTSVEHTQTGRETMQSHVSMLHLMKQLENMISRDEDRRTKPILERWRNERKNS